jgi:RND family efflux transporter MFP subunit
VLARLGTGQSRAALAARLAGEGVDALIRTLSVVRAPFAGVITARMVAGEEVLPSDAPLFRVEDASAVYVDAGFPRRLAADELDGRALAVNGAQTIALRLEARLPRFDPSVGLWVYRYRAPNPDLRLGDGMWVEVRVSGAPRPVVWVPAAAVVSRGGETYVVRAESGAYRAVPVETGPEESGRIPVLQGLASGQRVVTRGAYLLLYRDLKDVMQPTD